MGTKLYNSLIFLFLFFSVYEKTEAQSPDWLWVKDLGGNDPGPYLTIALDTSGNVYCAGSFYGTIDFDPGPGIFNLTSSGNEDTYISKFDPSGNFIWVKSIGGPESDWATSIAVDASGDVYYTGFFRDTVDFDPGAGIFNLTSAGSADIFISKLDALGNFVWAKNIGSRDSDFGKSIAIDDFGNIYTTGFFRDTADFDPGPGVFNLMSTIGDTVDIFISKLDSSGNFLWAKQFGGTGIEIVGEIAVDPSGNGNVYTTGYFDGSADFDPGTGTYNLISAGYEDIFISKLDSSGNFIFAKRIGGQSDDYGVSIAINTSGNGEIYTAGAYTGQVFFGPNFYLLGSGSFISKYDSTGNFIWAKGIYGAPVPEIVSIKLDPNGNGDVYTTGKFYGTVDFDPGVDTFNLTAFSVNQCDIFLSKLDSSGNFIWAKPIGDIFDESGKSIAIDALSNLYFAGRVGSPSLQVGSTTLINPGGGSLNFIAKLDNVISRIETVRSNNGISVYPNPAKELLVISHPLIGNKKNAVTISDVTGKIIYTTTTSQSERTEVKTSNFSDGIYFVQIKSENFIGEKKFIVVK